MTCVARQARDCLRGASPTVTEPQSSSADGKAVYTGTEESKQPKGAVRQGSYVRDAKVREMRTADTILHIIQDRGKRKLPLDDVYRQLYTPALSLRAYAKLSRNTGAMTPGSTADTVDGRSTQKIAQIIDAIRYERWQWTPVRRIAIPKRTGGTRPLGMPPWADKVVQDIMRSILAAYYAPHFSDHSHGFRPHRGCQTALTTLHDPGGGTTWFLDGDIKGCFDPASGYSCQEPEVGQGLADLRRVIPDRPTPYQGRPGPWVTGLSGPRSTALDDDRP
jgi:hypothetical protein